MSHPPNAGYRRGDNWSNCPVCGFDYRASEFRRRWDGLMVCRDDWEPRHPQEFLKARREDTRARVIAGPKDVFDLMPNFPACVEFETEVTSDTMTITWAAVPRATFYHVRVFPQGAPMTEPYVTSDLTYEIDGLRPETDYMVMVNAGNENGVGSTGLATSGQGRPNCDGEVVTTEAAPPAFRWGLTDITGDGYEGHAFEGVQAGSDPFYGLDSVNPLKLISRDVFANNDNLIAAICDENGDEVHQSTGLRTAAFRFDYDNREDAERSGYTVGFADDTLDQNNFFNFKAVKVGLGLGSGINEVTPGNEFDAMGTWLLDQNPSDIPDDLPAAGTRYGRVVIDFDAETVSVYGGDSAATVALLSTEAFVPNGPVAIRFLSFILSEDYDLGVTAYVTQAQIEAAGFSIGGAIGWAE